ncbi:MAG: lytic transglycosylase domain-containing protein [Chitinophagaceae bacterium]|nr:lytic transglycosylase domain-containing protein [Chitinophagaceae bacterium]
MLKKILAGVIGFTFFTTLLAFAGKDDVNHFRIASGFSDTADVRDSAGSIEVNDPKQAFKNLFIVDGQTSGFSTQRLNPLAVSFVEDYVGKMGKTMTDMKGWGKPYFDLMDGILESHGVPKELKYLAVIESNLKSGARSWAGAVGPWQFMPETARIMGLKVSNKFDERRDLTKSTHAASRYLNNLFALYGDWLLVIAAYNGGPGRVNSAIRRSGSRDFWMLQRFLPNESKNHVKKFIATHYIMEGQGSIATATKAEALIFATQTITTPTDVAGSKLQAISGRYNASVIARHVEMDIKAFHKLNPDFDRLVASNGNYQLRLPDGKMDLFMAKKPDILNESMKLLLAQVSN